jgi:hypothetical protein
MSPARTAAMSSRLDGLAARASVPVRPSPEGRDLRQAGNTAGKLTGREDRRASPAAARPARFLSCLANAGAVPRRGSDVGTSPLLGQKLEEA